MSERAATTETQSRTLGFSLETLQRLSEARDDPQWLREMRLRAWAAYESLPLPGRSDERWRRTDPSAIPLDSFQPPGEPLVLADTAETLPAGVRAIPLPRAQRAGLTVQINATSVLGELQAELAQKGVLFTSVEKAARDYPELCQRYLMAAIPPHDHKLAALHSAFLTGGVFLYVPPGVSVELPLHNLVYVDTPGLALFPHTLVIAERGSAVTLADEYHSGAAADGKPALVLPVVELFLAEGAQVRYCSFQDLSRETYFLAFQRNMLEGAQAHLLTFQNVFGGKVSKSHQESLLKGKGSASEMLGLGFGDGAQHYDVVTLQDHEAPHTTSNLLFKTALKDNARSLYYGSVHIRKGAQQARAFQTDKNLLLSGQAKADSVPVLEIEADEVRCSHAATVGPVEEDHLFYLMSRGLDRHQAERMLAEAFFEPLSQRIPVGWLKERVWAAVQRKMGAE